MGRFLTHWPVLDGSKTMRDLKKKQKNTVYGKINKLVLFGP